MQEIKAVPLRGAGDLSDVPAFEAFQPEQPKDGAQEGDIEECTCRALLL